MRASFPQCVSDNLNAIVSESGIFRQRDNAVNLGGKDILRLRVSSESGGKAADQSRNKCAEDKGEKISESRTRYHKIIVILLALIIFPLAFVAGRKIGEWHDRRVIFGPNVSGQGPTEAKENL